MATLVKQLRYLPQVFANQPLYAISKLSMSTTTTNNDLLISAEPRRFDNLYLDLSLQNDDIFEQQLDHSLSKWQLDGIRALWAYTPSTKCHLIPILVEVSLAVFCIITQLSNTYTVH
eukprot:126652_1